MHFKFRAFRAVDDLETSLKYKEAHQNVLKEYGITNVTSNREDWIADPNIYCVVAELFPGMEIVGGVRIQVSVPEILLPVERAIGRMDQRIFDVVAEFRKNGGVGELCALWNSKQIAGLGISLLLIRAAISISDKLKIKTLMCICADYTIQMFQQVGFKINDSLGLNGSFPYPNQTYVARVLGILNPKTLETAEPYDKERIESLRSDPLQTFNEKGTSGNINIQYMLKT
jgi:hypothetical protein